ncbi:DUF308 domain-containing protein [Dactylosporangium roseum]|uniref:DUF308 domain-containing protein n=1 Tax=Dactylosporangium roseum TaxID=47989 RepID=A0ABY5YZX1_9ACTN|nr:DUF308 domain-containing protein [Dactylosporangium roseum]UWZ35300.1 DUF308 domain-containing protein [Dactylosporangium roseum]
MPGGGARRGRRDNGLVAQEYAVVGDVDPRVGEHLLDVLAAGGIAAYLQPATDLHPVTRTTTLPARPTDRLYADREHLATARDFLTRLTSVPEQHTPPAEAAHPATASPTPPAARDKPPSREKPSPEAPGQEASAQEAKTSRKSDDETFASIIAGFHTTVDPGSAPWPAAEDLDSSSSTVPDMDTEPAPRTPLRRPADAVDRSLLDSLDTFGADLPDDDEEGYTPPPPPPLPRIAPSTLLAVVALIAGLLLLFWPDLLPLGAQTTLFLGFAAVLAGFVTLILRLRPGDEEDDDPDNGAKV